MQEEELKYQGMVHPGIEKRGRGERVKKQGRQEEHQEEGFPIPLLDDSRFTGTSTGADPLPCSGGGGHTPTKRAPRDQPSLIALALVAAHPLLL